VSDPDRPRYHQRDAVPRDLRTADELAQRGYLDLGAPRAELVTEGGEVALYSTSDARRRRDPLWARRSRPEESPRERDLVTTLAQGAAHGWIERLFESDFVVLDTETTGLGRRDEIIEVGVVDADGRALLDTRVWPRSGHVPDGARRVHGLGIEDLRGAPTWPDVLPELRALLDGRRVLAWNAPFDERMARQSSRLWRVSHDLPAFECAMRAYALARGVASGRRKLDTAARERGVATGHQAHRGADDARLSLAVLRSLAADGKAPPGEPPGAGG